jgi:UDP-glucose 4-epimerase
MNIVITGGNGYIGSHMAALLYAEGHTITILDNFSNSGPLAKESLLSICPNIEFINVDIKNKDALDFCFNSVLINGPIDGVFHFAGLKSVGQSNLEPLVYYQNNISGTLNLCEVMNKYGITNLIFSSSATVYGVPDLLPIAEDAKTSTCNPYGASKLMCEQILTDMAKANPQCRIAILRYFNPAGSHPSGQIGEAPIDIPNNLMPYVLDVAIGKRAFVSVYGDDYDTCDGTGVRDYIHVMDLVEGHAAAFQFLQNNCGAHTFNLGTGRGYSVLDIINKAMAITQQEIPYQVIARRSGDVASVFADNTKALSELGWAPTRDLTDIITDQWRWVLSQKKNAA